MERSDSRSAATPVSGVASLNATEHPALDSMPRKFRTNRERDRSYPFQGHGDEFHRGSPGLDSRELPPKGLRTRFGVVGLVAAHDDGVAIHTALTTHQEMYRYAAV